MKRAALVCYSGSEDEQPAELVEARVQKKRKLPAIPTTLVPAAPVDDPSLHQGRIRTTPHIDGQFAAHVYVAIRLKRNGVLQTFVDEILNRARQLAPTLQSFWVAGGNGMDRRAENARANELHISLSRATYIRAHQRDELKRAVKAVATRHSPFEMSFATLAELTNDERTRTFLTLEVGAGHDNFRKLSDALMPALKAIRQKEFYTNPRYHASIGWALLDPPTGSESTSPSLVPGPTSTPMTPPERSSPPPQVQNSFSRIPRFPPALMPTLNEEFGPRLTLVKLGMSEIEDIYLKIGKDVFKSPLLGE